MDVTGETKRKALTLENGAIEVNVCFYLKTADGTTYRCNHKHLKQTTHPLLKHLW